MTADPVLPVFRPSLWTVELQAIAQVYYWAIVEMMPADVFEITIGECPMFAFLPFTYNTYIPLKCFIAIRC